jgi:hypothetical protein
MQAPLRPGKANLSLVAHYGDKPPEIDALIRDAQEILQEELPLAFRKYDIRQVHATLISLEGHRTGNVIINANYTRFCHERRAIDFKKAFKLLAKSDFLPFAVRIGGYREHSDYPFTSRGTHPYQRSFSIQGDIAVAMGWPCDGKDYPPVLDRLRRAFNSANILHKYHRTTDDTDNDFYFVLGNIILENTSHATLQNAHARMLEFLSCRDPLVVTVAREHLRIIAYTDPKVPPDTTRSYALDEAEAKLDEIKSLYRDTAT